MLFHKKNLKMPNNLSEILKSMFTAPFRNLVLILLFGFMAFFMYMQNKKEDRMLGALEKISDAIDKQSVIKQQESERLKDIVNAILPIPDLIKPIIPEIKELRDEVLYKWNRKRN